MWSGVRGGWTLLRVGGCCDHWSTGRVLAGRRLGCVRGRGRAGGCRSIAGAALGIVVVRVSGIIVARWLVGVQFYVGGRLVGSARLVGLDCGAEAVLVGHVVHLAVNSVGVRVTIATCSLSILVAGLLVVLGPTVSVVDVVSPGEWHGCVLSRWRRLVLELVRLA